ncbi:MAG: 3-isopropylmalate dehydratase large subunit [Dictyoglomus sp.]|nr:3-isopropylmalate dehydratase large subunit [Dictyoglomus sp.]MDW8187957.1 3-isopropylmalate dehydratase large subunit [Dictyoglomus sp.]
MGKTISEKIFSNHSGNSVKAGDIVVAKVDALMGQDGTAPLAIKVFEELGGKMTIDNNKVLLVLDHSAPPPNEGVANLHKLMRDFAEKYRTQLSEIGEGVCHQVFMERGLALPGSLIIGADSHTCTYGVLNCFATGVGSSELASAMYTGKLWFKVPETVKIILRGKLRKGITAKDVILYLVGFFKADGLTYKAIEFDGELIRELSIDGRATITNMVVEMGAKAGIMPFDEKTKGFFREIGIDIEEGISSDKDANFSEVYDFDLSNLEPQVALPHQVDNVFPISSVDRIKIQEAFLGTCTNGRLEDLRVSAELLKGKKVAKGVRMIVAPASKKIYLQALKEGLIEIFLSAGAIVVNPGCGPCVGTHQGVPADGENVISTANRNFKGRMGNNKAFIYLASPLTVTASAIRGEITNPLEVMD